MINYIARRKVRLIRTDFDMNEQRELTCISCPIGCHLTVTLVDGAVTGVSGNTCPRGEVYAKAECTAPVRMVTGLVRIEGRNEPLSVKTAQAIPKSSVAECVEILAKTEIKAPVRAGDVVIADVCGSGIDVIATKSAE